ncbi:MAG: prenyltransferase/squalene oxidase repeat-containing protein [Armatimonadota bacterium]
MTDNIQKNYYNLVLKMAPRLLTLLDREEFSATYGCFDRSFWHYKFITDYPCARYQEAVLVLALLYTQQFPGNVYFRNERVLNWAKAALLYWTRIQNKDGSFNEAYPNEHSFVTTAFTLYAVSESFLILSDYMEEEETARVLKSIEKAALWLINNEDPWVANHTAGAVTALYNTHLITGDNKYKKGAVKKLNYVLNMQSKEGWFYEYGSADPGYLSLTIDFLAKYYDKSNDEKVKEHLKEACGFLGYFLHSDGSFGGDYGSRNTEFFYPHGLEIFKSECDHANRILHKFYPALEVERIANPNYMDDRYFAFEASNFLQSALSYKKASEVQDEKMSLERDYFIEFPEAGIITVQNKKYQAVLNYKKGGVLKVFSRKNGHNMGELVFSDAGFLAELQEKKNRKAISQFYFNKFNLSKENSKIAFHSSMINWRDTRPLKNLIVPFRLFNYILGPSFTIMKHFNNIMKKILFKGKKYLPVMINKEIEFKDEEITVRDLIYTKLKFMKIKKVDHIVPYHTSATKYFLNSSLSSGSYRFPNLAEQINKKSHAELFYKLDFRASVPQVSGGAVDGN